MRAYTYLFMTCVICSSAPVFAQDIPPLPVEEQAPPQPAATPQPTTPNVKQEAKPQAPPKEKSNAPGPGQRLVGRLKHSFRALAWLETTGYTVGTTMHRGSGRFSSRASDLGGPQVMGYTLQERNGVISGLVLALLAKGCIGLGAAGTAASAFSVTGSTTTREYRSDGSVWETTTTSYEVSDPGQLDAAQNMLDNSGTSNIAGYEGGQNFEFTYFTDDWLGQGRGETQGVRTNFLLGFPAGDRMIFEAGYGWGRTVSTYDDTVVESRFNGVPLRLLAPFGPFVAQAGMDLNFSALFTILDDGPSIGERTQPWPLSLSMHAFLWRLHASAGIEVSRIFKRDVGYNLGLGMRF